ncbi:2-polyprenylphenol 6-hydroxylase [Enterovirga sp.]|uniref:2-polyprenylphenol 6-hydroxylase n=1 Tax=Enterovirga sp. TaxID=2026350 RepID=UPI002626481A|nr:2-polyprenylphenol 6-hydroxylase [Enterovirga sp.]MDB5590760.1 putative ubiquinone biosynthesis protein [Enterovirga sp.]
MIAGLVHLARNLRAGFVLAREGALALVDPSALPPGAQLAIRLARLLERRGAASGAARLSAALTRLGPSYVKFGQFLATRPDIVGAAASRDLESLQDRMPPFSQAEAVAMVELSLGRPLDQAFAEFGPPVAAASIAQVHRATARLDGRDLAVKVVRPGVRERFARDLQAMRFAARLAERRLPVARRLRPTEIVETLARSVAVETDLRLEAAALSELAENTEGDPDFRVPHPDWELTGRDVLVTEWIDGIPLHRLDAIEAAGHDRAALAKTVIQSFLRHAIRDGFFHADMHPGNLMVDPQGRLVAVDTGIMGRLGMKERRFLAEILLGFILRDYRRVAVVHFEAGYVPARHSVEDFAQAIRAIGEPIHRRRADQISMARLLTLLFEITSLFDMETRTELVMLQKTMVVVEGVARSLDPRLDIWAVSEPVVRSWIERNLGPIGRAEEAGRGLLALARVAGDLPVMAQQAERLLAKLDAAADRGIALERETVFGTGRHPTRSLRFIAAGIWVVVLMLVVMALSGG